MLDQAFQGNTRYLRDLISSFFLPNCLGLSPGRCYFQTGDCHLNEGCPDTVPSPSCPNKEREK